jgi:hypothetical protein
MVIFVLGAVLGWYGFPALVRSQIISVSNNILLLVIYVKPHFPTIFLTVTGLDFNSVQSEYIFEDCKNGFPAAPIRHLSSAVLSYIVLRGETGYFSRYTDRLSAEQPGFESRYEKYVFSTCSDAHPVST